MPKILEAHLENFFPFMGLMHGESKLLSFKECHFYLPEIDRRSCIFVLMYMKAHAPIAHLLKGNLLKLIDVVIEQDAQILSKIYPNTPQRIIAVFRSEKVGGLGGNAPKKGYHPFTPSVKPVLN
ncbi:hypothetical protein [Pseudanabaena sp. PCC 6802]|uniref:hypothetical protein n=1 Tax=Pseudanabaena sp. PCC 6802 TaxID=118173 RepID=UPI00036F4AA8|nr:hypothetical protein [Pseudanabaena sp. PCC 6802]